MGARHRNQEGKDKDSSILPSSLGLEDLREFLGSEITELRELHTRKNGAKRGARRDKSLLDE